MCVHMYKYIFIYIYIHILYTQIYIEYLLYVIQISKIPNLKLSHIIN